MRYNPRPWTAKAACQGRRGFITESGSPRKKPDATTQAHWDLAKEVCMGCPVMRQCRRDTLGEPYGVWGGYDEYQRHQIRKALVKAAAKWPRDKRLRWGKRASDLRDRGVKWTDIQIAVGLPQDLALQLTVEWREHRALKSAAEKSRPAKVVALPRRKPSFPDANGSLDMWVRHNGGIADAYYKGETADGVWIRAHVRVSNLGHAIKFIPADDIRFHHQIPRFTVEYKERPDRGKSRESAA